jgi:hypothetical protein
LSQHVAVDHEAQHPAVRQTGERAEGVGGFEHAAACDGLPGLGAG